MKKLYGITVAMVTPFTADDKVDYKALEGITNMLIEKGVDCLYPCGTTGEMLRLTVEERKKIAETIVKTADHRVTVFIHCGCMRQDDTIELIKHARKIGADGAGIVSPQYFHASDYELSQYFINVAKEVPDFPIYLYNIPQCAANDLKPEMIKDVLKEAKNIVGIKYSWADIGRTIDYLAINNYDFSVLHGMDRALVSFLATGCDGCVSGISCVFPEPFVKTYQLYKQGKIEEAQKLQRICVKFVDALKGGANMSYFKEALTLRGLTGGHMRAPQLDISVEEIMRMKVQLEQLCKQAGIALVL